MGMTSTDGDSDPDLLWNALHVLEGLLDADLAEVEHTEPSTAQIWRFLETTLANLGMPTPPALEKVIEFRQTLTKESDRGCALAVACYIDAELKELLRSYLIDDQKEVDNLFHVSGPLSSFSARIDVCHALGLIGPQVRRDLHLMRRIRNDFAHQPGQIDFADESIASRCGELYHDLLQESLPPRKRFIRVALGVLGLLRAIEMTTTHREPGLDIDIGASGVRGWAREIRESMRTWASELTNPSDEPQVHRG